MSYHILFKLNLFLINLAGYIRYIKYFFLHHEYFTLVKKNVELIKKENEEKVCYICALGPSFSEVDLENLKGDTIVVNRFFRHGKTHPSFVPTYYMIVDSAFGVGENDSLYRECLTSYINKGTKYIINSRCSNSTPKDIDTTNLYYISTFKGRFNSNKEIRIDRVMPALGNVASAAILCAIGMGYKKIVLLGCDFNSFTTPFRYHCYNEPGERKKIRLYFELFCYSFAANMHGEIAKYAEREGITIINSTKGSLIDAYPMEIKESLYYPNGG